MRMARFLARHPKVGRLAARIGPLHRHVSSQVWAALEAQPGFNERMRAAEAELAAGKGVRYQVRDLR